MVRAAGIFAKGADNANAGAGPPRAPPGGAGGRGGGRLGATVDDYNQAGARPSSAPAKRPSRLSVAAGAGKAFKPTHFSMLFDRGDLPIKW